MSSVLRQETQTIIVNDATYEVGEQIARTPEAVLALESLGSLVLARRITSDGTPLTMKVVAGDVTPPTRPDEAIFKADARVRRAFYDEYDAYRRALQDLVEIDVPPVIGQVQATDSNAFFHLHQHDTHTTSIIPYEEYGPPAHRLYRLDLATIVE